MLVRFFLLQKRLLKKYSFLVMLCLAPLFAAGISGLAKEQSGIATIALCVPEEDPVAGEVADRLLAGEGVFRYLSCEEETEARALVESGEADAAWIFSGNMEKKMQKLAEKRRVRPLVTVVERQDSVSLTLGREILSGAIYPAFSYAVYESYVRKDLGLEEISEERLRQTYESVVVEGSLFQMVYPDGTPGEEEDFTYVQAPLRGILAIWFTFVGFSATLVFMQDESRGVYGRVPAAKRLFASYGACAVFLADAGIVLLLACKLAGVFTDWRREVASCAVFACCVLAFVNLLRLLCRTPQRMGMLLLPLGAVMLALCPVFLNLQYFRAGKMLLPPWHYLQSIHNVRYLYFMIVYTILLALISVLVQWLQNRTGQSTSI